jgi:hypothetical protein
MPNAALATPSSAAGAGDDERLHLARCGGEGRAGRGVEVELGGLAGEGPFMLSTTWIMHTCTTPVWPEVRAILKPEL